MKIFSINDALPRIEQVKKENKKIVLAGGCFDILHYGHVRFLEEAKKSIENSFLVLLLESDERVKLLKGEGRPVFKQPERAEMLSAIEMTDLIILLPKDFKGMDYGQLTQKIKPDVTAVTIDDPLLIKKRMETEKAGGVLKIVTPRLKAYSTSKLIELLGLNP